MLSLKMCSRYKTLDRIVRNGITATPPAMVYNFRHSINQRRMMGNTVRPNVMRVSSEHAANVISQGSRDLLIITTDGSVHGNNAGSAAVLRLCFGKPKNDQVKTTVKHMVGVGSSRAEIAAVALGCETALKEGITSGRRVMLIMDSYHDFYDVSLQVTKSSIHKLGSPAFKKSLMRVAESSAGVMITNVKSWHSPGGFFDHKAADVLAGMATNKARAKSFKHDWAHHVPRLDTDHESLQWLRVSEKPDKRKPGSLTAHKLKSKLRRDLDIRV